MKLLLFKAKKPSLHTSQFCPPRPFFPCRKKPPFPQGQDGLSPLALFWRRQAAGDWRRGNASSPKRPYLNNQPNSPASPPARNQHLAAKHPNPQGQSSPMPPNANKCERETFSPPLQRKACRFATEERNPGPNKRQPQIPQAKQTSPLGRQPPQKREKPTQRIMRNFLPTPPKTRKCASRKAAPKPDSSHQSPQTNPSRRLVSQSPPKLSPPPQRKKKKQPSAKRDLGGSFALFALANELFLTFFLFF